MVSKRIKVLIRSIVLSLSLFICSQFLGALNVNNIKQVQAVNTRPPVIMLDMAHRDSIKDNGAEYLWWNEREIVNSITEKVAERLVNKGYTVTLTREYDQSISINDRVKLANNTDYDYYISIHANSCEGCNKGTGVESYYNGTVTKILSENITRDLSSTFNIPNRGDFSSPYYNKRIPNSTLLELGFINHDKDRDILLNEQDKIADIIAFNVDIAYKTLSQK